MIKDFSKTAIMAGDRNISYDEMQDYINLFAQHTPREAGQKTVIFGENREGWIFAFFSIWQNKGLAVPVDASSTVSDVEYILRDCEPSCIWTTKEREAVAREAVTKSGLGISILLIDDYEHATLTEKGQSIDLTAPLNLENKEAALIIYTSGTTGSPKGVVLSYANIYANVYSVTQDVPIFNPDRRTMILLPLHHVLPLVGTVVMPIMTGGGVAICPSMTGPDIMDTLCRGKIAIFIGVPRLWQTLYMGIKKKIDATALTRGLFKLCEKVNSMKFSRFVFQSVHKKLGGNIAYFISGGAALDTEIGNGLKTLGITVLEGYGMTETAPMIAFTRPGDIIPGCVGLPLNTVKVKIENGEICATGPNVMLGYYNRPEETAAVIDKDGYVHTGDLGFIDDLGRIHITGRSKEIIVLSNGKNVQPNEIEFKLEKYDDKVKEAAVVQDGDMLRAIIVPQDSWARNLTDAQVEEELKRQVIEPYNLSVTNYKKLMSIMVYRGDLPRTKMDKLQRFKLKDLLLQKGGQEKEKQTEVIEQVDLKEYQILKDYIESEKKVKLKPSDHIETDLAFDSLDNVGLQTFIEQTFGMEMKAASFATFPNVKAIAEHIAGGKTRMEVENIDWTKMLQEDTSHLSLPTTSWILPTSAGLFRSYLKKHNSLEIKGTENLPKNERYILAPNHQSYIDSPVCLAGMEKEMLCNCYFYANEKHVRGMLMRYLAQHNNVILMEVQNLKNSILKLSEVLKQGKNLVIFPEGTRTRNGQMLPFKKTFAILSKELNVPIVPVRIKGAFEAMPSGQRLPNRNKIIVEYLPPVFPNKEESYDELSERVREAILNA